MTKAELGTKRLCPNCGTRYYDLNHDPILCPRCGTEFEVAVSRVRPQTASVKPTKNEAEEETEDAVAAELVSLEEADEEAGESGAVKAPGADEEVEVESDDEDDTFLADDEEDDEEDVGGIIGDVDEEEP